MITMVDKRAQPVIFQTRMVQGILRHGKTQTRRLLKPQPSAIDAVAAQYTEYDRGHVTVITVSGLEVVSPYGVPGIHLWLRETCTLLAMPTGLEGADHLIRGPLLGQSLADRYGVPHLAGWQLAAWHDGTPDPGGWATKLRRVSGIHMPRWACRVVLEVTAIRAERLQRLTVSDALSEGVTALGADWLRANFPEYDREYADYLTRDAVCLARNEPISDQPNAPIRRAAPPLGPDPITKYARLWDTLNPAHPWSTNPYVRVVSFARLEA
ncbi:hypothetical protein Deipe_1563 [Deinococcus peraridilitoris DSM 19664]|uniref:Uncharacterized protein n=2 Tax=Deinococcus TaxID=1298 RepID=L0A0Y9_DEIPD|nr:hypothetical protein Deipe_1563 [Deinococcus peraridilitoris DSM 19664]